MKKKYTYLLLFCSLFLQAQQTVFQTKLNSATLPKENKISEKLAADYLNTAYVAQNRFNLEQNLIVKMPDNTVINAIYEKSIVYSVGSYSAIYKVLNDESAQLVFSEYGNAITGMYQSSGNNKYMFQQTSENIFAISEVNEMSFIEKDKTIDYEVVQDSNEQGDALANSDVCSAATPVCSGSTTIDVMVVYTPSARGLWGSVATSNANITTSITNINTALANSGISNIIFNLVYVGEVAYTESGSFSTDLSNLRGTSDGVMDEIHALRDTYGADLVGLVIGSPTSSCGLGNLNSSPTNYSSNSAFTVTLYSCVVSNYSLAHEFGHNMGLNHDWYVNTNLNPCSHHHGYTNKTAITNGAASTPAQRWRTIMAYNDECLAATGSNCSRVNRWANPSVNYNGEPSGIAIGQPNPSNEAFGFSRFACVVSGFRASTLSTEEFSKSNISVFPNPIKNSVTVNCDAEISKIVVYNYIGQLVLTSNKKVFNTDSLISGVYFLNIFDIDGKKIGVKKVIKE